MDESQYARLSEAELKAFFDRLLPNGFAGRDVLAELAPEGWEKSPLLACFHPSPEQIFRECLQIHRNMERLARERQKREGNEPNPAGRPAPTIEQICADWKDEPLNMTEEVTELVGQCVWDVFSDNHAVIAQDGRTVDIGSFRAASAFLDEYVTGSTRDSYCGDENRFYMGSNWISQRADLSPVYRMIFRRLNSLGADWEYHFPRLHLVDLSSMRDALNNTKPGDYSPSDAFGKELAERERQAELENSCAELDAIFEQSCREALDSPPPATVRAYQDIFGRDPKGWPPV
jgi:hypothetical protein